MSAKQYYLRQAEACMRLAERAEQESAALSLLSAAAEYADKARLADATEARASAVAAA